jgi:ESCRT-II complex subunit VPS22
MIQSVPCELNTDHTTVMLLAQSSNGCISSARIQKEMEWNPQRTETVLNLLLQEGMVWVDSTPTETLFWFPSLFTTSSSLSCLATT